MLRTAGTVLFLPGRATRDYLIGKRARYLPPFRIYLIFNVALYFLLELFFGNARVSINIGFDLQTGPNEDVGPVELGEAVIAYAPQLGFVMLPIAAFLLKSLYFRRPYTYGEHLVAALHIKGGIAGWLCLVLMTNALIGSLLPLMGLTYELSGSLIASVSGLLLLAYMILSLQFIYGGNILLNLTRVLVLLGSYLVFATLGIVLVALVI